ncbi:hypothetical protein KOR34_18650 [Posidoniimonas corsicana]|uniref:Uncharacterized protein n=1 Tax=Posidoniimonas corsicana TaxID=1938618 RepID=A0A5C5VG49_9BACT|nr:hypothetical protein [Posidoniimonas corsicana]TWT36920.1 hypothetical protein KOR34_18650 [Posidoniimonas corsicana]
MNWSTLRAASAFLPMVALIATGPPAAQAADTDVLMIEEHWELQVGGPDADRSAPQVSMVMSPTGHLDGNFFVVTVNHGSFPDFSPGGVQVQHWIGDHCADAKNSYSKYSLIYDGETVSWKQRMTLDGGTLSFEVIDGSSESIGTFGANGLLKDTISVSQTRLNTYVPAISLTESGIGFAGNRVSSLTLKKLVWKTADGQYHELNAPIDISTGLDP